MNLPCSLCLLALLCALGSHGQKNGEKKKADPLEFHRKLFRLKRAEHIRGLETVLMMEDVTKKARMINIMLETIIKTILNAKEKLERLNYKAGDPHPQDEKTRDYLSNVLENTALFTDLLVRFPFISQNELRNKYNSLRDTLKWAKEICEKSGVYAGEHERILYSLGQETGLDDPDPEYVNPFKNMPESDTMTDEERLEKYQEIKRKEKMEAKKKKRKGGPKLSRKEL